MFSLQNHESLQVRNGIASATAVYRGCSESVRLAPSVITSGLHAGVSLVLATVIRGGTGAATLVAVTSIDWLGSYVPEIASTTTIGFVELTMASSDRRRRAIRLMESLII